MKSVPIEDRASKLFASLHALSARTQGTNTQILAAAHKRMDAVQKQMQALGPLVLTRHGAEDEYKSLALEAGQLSVVIGQCNESHISR